MNQLWLHTEHFGYLFCSHVLCYEICVGFLSVIRTKLLKKKLSELHVCFYVFGSHSSSISESNH